MAENVFGEFNKKSSDGQKDARRVPEGIRRMDCKWDRRENLESVLEMFWRCSGEQKELGAQNETGPSLENESWRRIIFGEIYKKCSDGRAQ